MARYFISATSEKQDVKFKAKTSEEIITKAQNLLDQSKLWDLMIYDADDDEFIKCHHNGLTTYKGKKYIDYSITDLLP